MESTMVRMEKSRLQFFMFSSFCFEDGDTRANVNNREHQRLIPEDPTQHLIHLSAST
jgi:hypothetical protein